MEKNTLLHLKIHLLAPILTSNLVS